MSAIKFSRIDARLIHGQIIVKWSGNSGVDSIYIVDNETAADDFMKDIFISLQKNYAFKVKVFSVAEVIDEWQRNQFGNDKVMLLFKELEQAVETIDAGLPIDVLNVGGIPKTRANKTITDYVALTNQQFTELKRVAQDYDVTVFFQAVPDLAKKRLDEVKVKW